MARVQAHDEDTQKHWRCSTELDSTHHKRTRHIFRAYHSNAVLTHLVTMMKRRLNVMQNGIIISANSFFSPNPSFMNV